MAYARRDIRGGAIQTTLSAAITSGQTSCAIVASTGWPDGSVNGSFYVVIDPGTASEEKVLCSTRSSLTVNFTTRGADGTTASSHAAGAVIYPVATAVDFDEANYAVSQTVGKVTTSGDLLVASGANAFARLAKGSNSTLLVTDSGGTVGYSTATAAMIAANAVTNAKLAGMTRGTVKVGDSGGAASDLALGASGYYLKSNGTDAVWSAITNLGTVVYKTADEAVTSSTTLQNDNHLLFTATAASVFAFEGMLLVNRASGSDGGIKIAFGEDTTTTRGTAAIIGPGVSYTSGQTANNVNLITDSTVAVTTSVDTYTFWGIHTGNGGTFRLLWAQNSSSSAATNVLAGSYLQYQAIA